MASPNSNRLGNNGGRFYDFLNRPVLIDCQFLVDSTNANGLGISSLKGSGVQNVFMHTTQTAGTGNNGYVNPNPATGILLVQLNNNYARAAGGFSSYVSPTTGGNVAINGSALTTHAPYVITSVGHGTAGAVTIAPVADSSGSLASTWFTIYDSYGNTYIVWFSVSGVGAAPQGVSGTLVQQSISTNDTAGTIGADLVTTLGGLLAAQPGNLSAPSGVYSFTAAGTTTVTVTNTLTVPFPGGPADGTVATGFTFAVTKDQTNLQNWQAVGLQKGVTPAVGASFIATATGYSSRGGSTGIVKVPSISGVTSLEPIGDINVSLGPIPMGGSPNVGGWAMFQFLNATSSSVTTQIPTNPADNTVVKLSFVVEAGSILISGE